MKNVLVIFAIVLVVGVGGYMVMNSGNPTPQVEIEEVTEPQENLIPEKEATDDASLSSGDAKTFTVEGTPFAFSLKEIRVKKGDTVKIVFNNKEGFHDWVLDEFNAKTPQLKAGNSATVEFVADQVGTFEYYCSVGNHRAQGMVGSFIVE